MWVCKKCTEKIDNQFDACWNCGWEKERINFKKNLGKENLNKQRKKLVVTESQNLDSIEQRNKSSRLKICKDCGAEVSKKADACPSCGAKLNQGRRWFSEFFSNIVTLIILGVIALTYIGLFAGESQKTESDLKKELTEKCNEAVTLTQQGVYEKSFLASCIQGGLIQLRNQGQLK